MLYDSELCSNSTYWQNYRMISIILLAVGILAFFIISLLLIRYLYIHDKGKRNKKNIITYITLIVISLLVFTAGVILSNHISGKTKNLPYCWTIEE